MYSFTNQTAIITGGTRGIGRGISEAFLKKGAHVIATFAKDEIGAKKFLDENSQYENKIDVIKCDVTNKSEISDFFSKVEEKFNKIEILVNNSGIKKDSIMALMAPEDWATVLNTNLTGNYYMGQKAIHLFLPHKYGRIINISSVGGRLALAGQTNYAASKAGQMAMSKALSKEVGKKGITVNCVAPGFIDTELLSDLTEDQKKEYKKMIPLKKFGSIEDVANGVLFLASKESSYITGVTLDIAGGL